MANSEFKYDEVTNPLELEKQKINKDRLIDTCVGVNRKLGYKLKAALRNDVQYNMDTLRRMNELYNYLKDNGYSYDVVARGDGRGLLTRVKGIGGSSLQITSAMADSGDRSGASAVGNIYTNGRSYFGSAQRPNDKAAQTGTVPMQNSFDMIKALTGSDEFTVVPEAPSRERSDSKGDMFYQVYDKQNRKVGTFQRLKQRQGGNQERQFELDEDQLAFDLGADENDTRTPLQKMVDATNQEMALLRDEENKIVKSNKGIQEELDDMSDIEITDEKTMAGLDLAKLREFNDRRDIAEALVYETRNNLDFDLASDDILPAYNPDDPEANGLKDLLAEELAGVNAERTIPERMAEGARNPELLKEGYTNVLSTVSNQLERVNVENAEVYFDEDHVIHWSGERNGEATSGEIGQVFLPDEHIIDTNFKTIQPNSDRNYHLVPGYHAYYLNRDYSEIVPKVDKDGYVLREDGTHYMRRVQGEDGLQKVTRDDLQGDSLVSEMKREAGRDRWRKNNGKRTYAQVATERAYKTIPVINTIKDEKTGKDVIMDVDGEPLQFNGNVIPIPNSDPSTFPEERIRNLERFIQEQNRNGADYKMPSVTERIPTLRDSLRFDGFEQSLNRQLGAIVQKQVLQPHAGSRDNIGLNKIYHGDVYASRIAENKLDQKAVVDTLAKRVRFDNEVMDMSPEELEAPFKRDAQGEILKDDRGNLLRDDFTTHRHNLRAFEDIFDRRLSSDGQALGLVHYLNDDVMINQDGMAVSQGDHGMGMASIYREMPYWYCNPVDRSLMAGNQRLRAEDVIQSRVAYIPYRGYTFEDGAVVTKSYAEDNELKIGDKISDNHGNKAIIGHVADPEQEDFFEENPEVDVIMNPSSVPSRNNTGLIIEMKENGNVKPLTYKGETLQGELGTLDIIKTDIKAEDKTQIYGKNSVRKGRSFGVQEAWVAQGLELDGVIKEVYGDNQKSFKNLREELNVVGIDVDDDGVFYSVNGASTADTFRQVQGADRDLERVDPSEGYDPEQGIALPKDGGVMDLPVSVELPTNQRVNSMYVLSEGSRKSQEMFDGKLMYHDYTQAYTDIAKYSHDLNETIHEHLDDYYEDPADLALIDFADAEQREKALSNIEDEKLRNKVDNQIQQGTTKIQNRVSQLSDRVINDHLGGYATEIERDGDDMHNYTNDKGEIVNTQYSDSNLIKKSTVKKDILGRQVPHSATGVVSPNPHLSLNTIGVGADIYEQMDLQDPENDRVLLWRDPALHDGSMRSFKIQKDENITGVSINPLVTESFGMDFDGDQVGLYAPKTKEAQQELKEKAAVEHHLIDRVSGKFAGNVGMDFVTGPLKGGYVHDNGVDYSDLNPDNLPKYSREKDTKITRGPLKGREEEVKDMTPKEQVEFMMTELAEEGKWKKIDQIWHNTVTSDRTLGSSGIAVSSREKTKDSLLYHALTGAKGKPKAVYSDADRWFDQEAERQGREISYGERLNYKDPDNPKALSQAAKDMRAGETSTMDYYDRGMHINQLVKTMENEKATNKEKAVAKAQYQYFMTPERPAKDKNGNLVKEFVGNDVKGNPQYEQVYKTNYGALALDDNKVRKAQGGKTDLTGQAGAKSQKLVGAMYESDKMLSAMSLTEPLTQATLKLKKNDEMTRPISEMLQDYNQMLKKGGQTKGQFSKGMDELYNGDRYGNLGLDISEEDKSNVHAALRNKDGHTKPIDVAVDDNASPLMKMNMYGFNSIRKLANENTKNIEQRVLDVNNKNKEPEHLHSFRDGVNSAKHVPEDLSSTSKSNVVRDIKGFQQRFLEHEKEQQQAEKQNEVEKEPKQRDEKAYSREVKQDYANEQSLKQAAAYNSDAADYKGKYHETAPSRDQYDPNDRSSNTGTYDRSSKDEGFVLE